jgi:hypothetical protein
MIIVSLFAFIVARKNAQTLYIALSPHLHRSPLDPTTLLAERGSKPVQAKV